MLEETGLPYEPHWCASTQRPDDAGVPLDQPEQQDPGDPRSERAGRQALPLFESGAILIYLAEKSGKLMPADPAGRYTTIQWLMFQMGGIGPMFGQVGFFHKFAGKDYEDKRPRDRYVAEARRLLAVVDKRLGESAWLAGDEYSIADIATFPWINNLIRFYGAGELVGIDEFANVERVLAAFLERPAVVRAMNIPARPEAAPDRAHSLFRSRERRRVRAASRARRLPRRGMVERACGEVRIGISGWRYAPWRGVFYPRAGAAARARVRLAHAADDRDQRLVLFAAAARVVRRVARRDARRFRLRA